MSKLKFVQKQPLQVLHKKGPVNFAKFAWNLLHQSLLHHIQSTASVWYGCWRKTLLIAISTEWLMLEFYNLLLLFCIYSSCAIYGHTIMQNITSWVLEITLSIFLQWNVGKIASVKIVSHKKRRLCRFIFRHHVLLQSLCVSIYICTTYNLVNVCEFRVRIFI